MRFLLLISALALLNSCAPVAYKNLKSAKGTDHCIDKFKPIVKRALYQTSVDVVGNHLSGILLIKQMPDSSTRIVFTNEVGFSFFDFEFAKNGVFTVHSIIPKMDRDAVKKTLKKDFELVLMNHLNAATAKVYTKNNEYYYAFRDGSDIYYYITDAKCAQLLRMERGDAKKKVLEATRGPLMDGMPEFVNIRHKILTLPLI